MQNVVAGNVKYKIQSIKDKLRQQEKVEEKPPEPEVATRRRTLVPQIDPKQLEKAPQIPQAIKLTQVESGLSSKQIIVPSFETTTKVFQEHFQILREVKHKIDLLKQAYYGQMDKKKTWE